MRTIASLLFASLVTLGLASCGGGNTLMTPPVGGPVPGYPVSLSMTDDPPVGVNVLFFQVTLTSATLTESGGGTVPLVTTPIQIDVTQLQALSAFLSTVNAGAGTYTGLSMTFSNPKLVIFNASDAALAGTCAVGGVCQITPTLPSTTVNLTSAPFPMTLEANGSLGLLVDFHLNTVIQPDLSVNLSAANGVTVSQLPSTPVGPPRFGYVRGTVEALHADQNAFTLQTLWGGTLWVTTNSSTAWNDFPSSACTTAGFGCLAVGEAVQVQVAGVDRSTGVTAAQITYLQGSSATTAEGTVLFAFPPLTNVANAPWTVSMILHWDPMNTSTLPLGGLAQVQIDPAATFSVDANGFTMPSGTSFAQASDLYVGQTVQVAIEPGTLQTVSTPPMAGGWTLPPTVSFTTNKLELEPTQISGSITSLGASGAGSFALGLNLAFVPFPLPTVTPSTTATLANVQTTGQTTFQGFTPDDATGLAVNQFVSVNGWIFAPSSSVASPVFVGPPTMAAQTVVLRPSPGS